MMPEVQGKAASNNEANVAYALDRKKIRYIFQYEIFGGRSVRGGQVVDFLVFIPFAVPLLVQGDYWHTGVMGADDRLQIAILFNYFKRIPILIWGHESDTKEEAMQAVSNKVY